MVSLLDFEARMVEVRRLRVFEELNLTWLGFFLGGGGGGDAAAVFAVFWLILNLN